MDYIYGLQSDIGITKETNQDAVAVKAVESDFGKIIFAIICDGMGGYDKGEVASASMVSALLNWFDNDFPSLGSNFTFEDVSTQWNYIIQSMNEKIINYGKFNQIALGTTLSMIMILNNKFYIGHIGDSRIYKIHEGKIVQLTEDHTVVAQKFARGEITKDEIETDEERNILTQCIGRLRRITPQFEFGTVESGNMFLLCSDGFRHEIAQSEMIDAFAPENNNSSNEIQLNIVRLIERAEQRNEEDNITAAVIKIL